MINFVVCCVLLVSLSAADAAAITNGQLFDMLQEKQADVTEYSRSDGSDVAPVADNVIDLPGAEDDEVDIGYLMERFGLLKENDGIVSTRDDPLVGGCHCYKTICSCCVAKRFTLQVLSKKISADIRACVTVKYIRGTHFVLIFALNGHTIYTKLASILSLPKVCGKITASATTAVVCLQFYDVNIANKHMCTRLLGVLDFKIKKVYFRFNVACFTLPKLSADWLTGFRSEERSLISTEKLHMDEDSFVTSNQDQRVKV